MLKDEKLFLLKRKISSYSGEDMFLGIYDNTDLANRQKVRYFEDCKTHDKWAKQAYFEVNLENDVEIIEVQEKQSDEVFPVKGQNIYLISQIDEMFGQIRKELFSISTNESKAKKFTEIEIEENYCSYYEYEELELNQLSFTNYDYPE